MRRPAGLLLVALVLAGCLTSGTSPGETANIPIPPAPEPLPLPAKVEWKALAAARIPRAEHCVANVDSKFYVIGGYVIAHPMSLPGAAGGVPTGPPVSLVEIYDAATDTWTTGPSYPVALDHCLAQAINGTVYVVYRSAAGGGSYKLPSGASQWQALPDPPNPHNAGVSAVLDGRLYATGGGGAAGTIVDVYDPATNQWSTREGRMPTRRDHTAGAAVHGRFFVIGGDVQGHSRNTDANEAYDPRKDNWTTEAPLPVVRGSLTAVAWMDRIVVMGGQNGATNVDAFNQVSAYEPLTDTWTELPVLPVGRHGFGAGVWKDQIYVFAGAPQQGVSGFSQAHRLGAINAP